MIIHASCVAIAGKGVLIVGPAGAGKSDLALRLIDGGAELVADDQTELHVENGVLIAGAPPTITGLIEIRQYGLVRLPSAGKTPVALYIDLSPLEEKLERMPEDDMVYLLDQAVKRLKLYAFAASTPAKIRATLLYSLVSGRA